MFGKERMDGGGDKVSISFCYRVKWIQCCSPDLVATFLLQLIFLFDNLFCLFFPLHTVTFFLDPNFSPLSAFTHLALHCDIFKAQHPASLFFWHSAHLGLHLGRQTLSEGYRITSQLETLCFLSKTIGFIVAVVVGWWGERSKSCFVIVVLFFSRFDSTYQNRWMKAQADLDLVLSQKWGRRSPLEKKMAGCNSFLWNKHEIS